VSVLVDADRQEQAARSQADILACSRAVGFGDVCRPIRKFRRSSGIAWEASASFATA
jgi:hypothetical protein